MNDEQKQIDELWNKFNNLNTEEIVNFSRDSIIRDLRHRVTSIEEKKIIEKELCLTQFIHYVSHQLIHFNPDRKIIDKQILQFRLRCGNRIDFFKKRLNKSKTPLLIAHYSFACFILEHGTHMKNVFTSTLQYSDYQLRHESKFHFLNAYQLLVMAFNLNNLYNIEEEKTLNQVVLNSIEVLKSEPKYLIEPLEIIAKLSIIHDDKLDELIKFGISNYNNIRYVDVQERFLKSILLLCDINKEKYGQTKTDIYTIIAELYENEAIGKESIVAIMELEKAKKYHDKLNHNEKIKEINQKIINHTKSIKYKEFPIPLTIPKISIEGKTNTEKIQFIANYPFLIPNLQKLKNDVEESKKANPIQEMFNTTFFEKEKPIYEKSEISQSLIRKSIFHIASAEKSFSLAVQQCEKLNQITSQDYFDFIKSFGFYDSTSLKIIETALERHFVEDYISSIHTLIPQIESTLRKILEEKGKMLTKPEEKIKMILLKEIIDKCVGIFDENVIHYLKIKFGDDEGMNQRNIISHAFSLGIDDFNHSFSFSLIYTIMRLLVLK